MNQRVQKVKIKNFKNIVEKEIDVRGQNVYAFGPNAAGKTSLLQALTLDIPKKALKQGTPKGEVVVELDDYVIEYLLKDGKSNKVNLFDKSGGGAPLSAPMTRIKELLGDEILNIDEFLNWTPSKKVAYVKELIGIDWSELDAVLKQKKEDLKYAKKLEKEIDAQIKALPINEIVEEIPVEPLREALKQAEDFNRKYDDFAAKIVRVRESLEQKKNLLKEIEAGIKEDTEKIEKGVQWLESNPRKESEKLRLELDAAFDNNAKLNEYALANDVRERGHEAVLKVDALDAEVKAMEKQKRDELEKATIPVKGLTFDSDQLYLEGLPFDGDTINTARKITAGLELNLAKHQDNAVKIARFDGSLLDNNSMKEVEQWAKDNGVQLFVEFVDRTGEELKIEIVETL